MSNADLNNNPGLLREESYLRKRGLEGLVNILQNMLRCLRYCTENAHFTLSRLRVLMSF